MSRLTDQENAWIMRVWGAAPGRARLAAEKAELERIITARTAKVAEQIAQAIEAVLDKPWHWTEGTGLKKALRDALDHSRYQFDPTCPRCAEALKICEQVEANPTGWGGPIAVSLARTVRAAIARAAAPAGEQGE